MEDSLCDLAMRSYVASPGIENREAIEAEQPLSIAAGELWDAVEHKDANAFKEAFKNAITIALNER
jgi:hypothetical protein